MTREKARARWAAAEQAATDAEKKFAAMGQAAADPRVVALLQETTKLRTEADRLFKELARLAEDDDN